MPYGKRHKYEFHPKFHKDFEKVLFKVDMLESEESTRREEVEMFQDMTYVLNKLENLLLPEEYFLLLMRYSMYQWSPKLKLLRDIGV